MIKLIKSIMAPITSLILLVIGGGLFMTFVSVRLKLDGHDPSVIGYVTSAFFAGLVLGSMMIHKIIERVGHIRAFAALGSLVIATIMLQGMYPTPISWIILRFFNGYLTAGLYITIESWLLVKSTLKTRGRILSIHMIAFYGGLAAGQFLLEPTDPKTFTPFSITILLIAIALVPVCITRVTAPSMEKKPYVNLFKLIKSSPVGVIGSLSSGAVLGSFYGLNPVFVQDMGINIKGVAEIMGFTIFSGLILQWPVGHLSDYVDRRKVLSAISFLVAVFCLLIIWSSFQSMTYLLIFTCIFGGVSFTIYPLSITHTIDMLDSDDLVSATGALYVAYGIGAIIGPILAAYIMDIVGPNGLYFFMAGVSLLTSVYILLRVIKKAPVPAEAKTSYVNVPKTTPVGQQLNHHTETIKENEQPQEHKEEQQIEETNNEKK